MDAMDAMNAGLLAEEKCFGRILENNKGGREFERVIHARDRHHHPTYDPPFVQEIIRSMRERGGGGFLLLCRSRSACGTNHGDMQ